VFWKFEEDQAGACRHRPPDFFAVLPRGKSTVSGGWPSRWNHLLALKISLHQKGLNWAREGGNLDRDFIDE